MASDDEPNSMEQQNSSDTNSFQVQANAGSQGAQAGQDVKSDYSNEGD